MARKTRKTGKKTPGKKPARSPKASRKPPSRRRAKGARTKARAPDPTLPPAGGGDTRPKARQHAAWLVEVTPRPGAADPEGKRLLHEAQALGIDARGARSAVVYELAGADREAACLLAEKLLSDPILEQAVVVGPSEEAARRGAAAPARGERVATCVRKPGVMDPVALSTVEAARDLGVSLEDVRLARRVYVEGDVREDELSRLAGKVLGNEALDRVVLGPEPLPPRGERARKTAKTLRREVPLLSLAGDELEKLSRSRTLALSRNEMEAVQAHYRSLEREPTDLELETIAQTWSEHCKHKTLTGPIDLVTVSRDGAEKRERIGNLLKETIFGATRELGLSRCVSVFEDNAGVVRFDEKTGIAVKVETHNHPSAIEPYGGSGTGVGGVIRDVLGTGLGARPIASVDVFCVGDLHAKDEAVPEGALHPRRLLGGVVSGVRDYGNRMGIPTVAGSVIQDERYVGNPLVYCGTIGTIPLDRVQKAARQGDRIVAAGGRTGRDGIHGATFSSDALTSESETVSSGAVQIGNAIEEKKVQDVLLRLRDSGALHAVTDCGAGGFSSAVGEMARETGAEVDLARAPLKYEGLSPWEIWVSEAQERMVLAVPKERVREVLAAFAAEGVEAVDLGVFRSDGKLIVRHGTTIVGELDSRFLHDGLPRTPRAARWVEREPERLSVRKPVLHGEALRALLAHPSICSKEWIVRQYDHEVQGQSGLKCFQGARADGPGDATAVAGAPGSVRGVLVGLGCQPRVSDDDPYLSAWASVDEAIRNVVATGGDPDACSLLDNFSWGDCRKPDRLGGIVRAARACREASLLHKAPFISGKDSLNNEYVLKDGRAIAIPGTLLVTCVAVYEDVAELVSMDWKEPGHAVYLLGETRAELGRSYWLDVVGGKGGAPPRPPREAASLYRKLHRAVKEGLVRAAHDLSEGGLAVALAESAFSGEVGARVDLSRVNRSADAASDEALLFSESGGRLLVVVAPVHRSRFEALLAGEAVAAIGETTREQKLSVVGLSGSAALDEPLVELKRAWQGTLPGLYE
ncbi:phosphoribosylformylglycinamidine synthase subunit PurL [bacterium]|nr:phosphoribosylformylglycinamidine synthase subunit PurL [bacterium]